MQFKFSPYTYEKTFINTQEGGEDDDGEAGEEEDEEEGEWDGEEEEEQVGAP